MQEIRCEKCNKLLFKRDGCGGHVEVLWNKDEFGKIDGFKGFVYIKCPRCGTMNTK